MPFLKFPRELRDKIYDLYVFEVDGYHFDYESGKLRASGNRHVDLNLMYTCKTVAAEMHHLALGRNVINFSTIKSERLKAGRFHLLFHQLYEHKSMMLRPLIEPMFQHYMTSELHTKMTGQYPQFEHLLHRMHDFDPSQTCHPLEKVSYHTCSTWGEADSSFRAFQDYLIELLSKETDYPEALENFYDSLSEAIRNDHLIYFRGEHFLGTDVLYSGSQQHEGNAQRPRREIYNLTVGPGRLRSDWSDRAAALRSGHLTSNFEPWGIPSDHELSQIDFPLAFGECDDIRQRVKWRFSAATAAIHFLKSISHDTRLGLKQIILHEDRHSVACSECHALGLIPFCLQNPQLHIERRVNVWWTMPAAGVMDFQGKTTIDDLKCFDYFENDEPDVKYFNKLCTSHFGESFCRWITEASALHANGMPAKSFSLVFDGNPAPDQTLQLFELVKEDAAWQVAQLHWFTENLLQPGLYEMMRGFYRSKVFPQIVSDIIEGKSFIRCDFPTGEMYQWERVSDMNRHLRPTQDRPYGNWVHTWHCIQAGNPHPLLPPTPLPPTFSQLILEELIPKELSGQST